MDKIVARELTDNQDHNDEWRKFIDAMHNDNRFAGGATDSQYTNLNIRINPRPISGMTHADGDGRQSNISKNRGDMSVDETEEVFNRDAVLEMQTLRGTVR